VHQEKHRGFEQLKTPSSSTTTKAPSNYKGKNPMTKAERVALQGKALFHLPQARTLDQGLAQEKEDQYHSH
jgi:hypothetical protein